MANIECTTQAEADAAAVRGDVIVWRAGYLVARGSARVYAYDSASVYARGSARVSARGSARVYAYDSASVYAADSASVSASGSASVYEGTTSSPLRRDRPRIVIGPLGSRNATLGASIPADGSDPIIYAGCWTGSLTEFAKRVHEVYPDGQFGAEYRAAVAFIRAIAGGRE